MKKNYLTIVISLMNFANAYTQFNNNGSTIKLTTGSYIVLQDINFINKGSFTQSAGTVKMTGSNNNTISGTIKPQFYSLIISKSAAKEVQLLTDLNVTGEILFTSGLLNLNTKNIFLLGTAILKGEAESSRIIGPNGGYVEVKALLNVPVATNPGNLGAYISSTKNLGNTIIRRGHQAQILGGGNNNSLLRYYEITPTNNMSLNATLRFQYFDGELNGLTETNSVLFKKVNNVSWVNQGFTTRNATVNYVIKNGITDFSRWTISNTLPGMRSEQPDITGRSAYSNTIIKPESAKVFIEKIYPTMAVKQNIYIQVGNINVHTMQVQVYDMQSKLCLNQQITYQSQWLRLPQLFTAGLYKIVVRSGVWKYQQSFMKE